MNSGRLKVTVTTYLDVSGLDWDESYPGCQTIEEVAAQQYEWANDGTCCVFDLLGEDYTVEVEPG